MKSKYPINKEFFPFSHFTAPFSLKTIRRAQKFMRVPAFIRKDPDLTTEVWTIPAYQGGEIELYSFTPKASAGPLPCLLDIHGGGFVFEGWVSHFKMAMLYAKGANCKVIYVRYRLAPDYPFPVPQEDCYAALLWVHAHAEELGIDPGRIGLIGDSAGGTLSAVSCLLARERGAAVRPLFQALIYPWLDDRSCSDSYRRFTDTPMWNSTLSKRVGPVINPRPEEIPIIMRSPVEVEDLSGMPPAYIETAEFDCLHDDGVLYARRLRAAGVNVLLYETKGTIHGFDTKMSAPTSRKMIARRIRYMRRMFWGK